MQTVKQDASFLSALQAWSAYRISEVLASMKPKHRAVDIAAAVAGSGNPAGA